MRSLRECIGTKVRARIGELKREIREKDECIRRKAECVAKADAMIADLSMQLGESGDRIDHLRSTLDLLRGKREAMVERIEELEYKLVVTERDAYALDIEKQEVTARLDRRVAALTARNNSLETEASKREERSARQRRKVKSVQNLLDVKEKEIGGLLEALSTLKARTSAPTMSDSRTRSHSPTLTQDSNTNRDTDSADEGWVPISP